METKNAGKIEKVKVEVKINKLKGERKTGWQKKGQTVIDSRAKRSGWKIDTKNKIKM